MLDGSFAVFRLSCYSIVRARLRRGRARRRQRRGGSRLLLLLSGRNVSECRDVMSWSGRRLTGNAFDGPEDEPRRAHLPVGDAGV